MKKVTGKFSKKATIAEIKKLEKKIEEIKRSNKSAWETYGNELAYGDMIQEERKLEREITKLQNKLEPSETYKRLVQISKEHQHELVFNCGPTVVLLLPGIEDDGEDYYWRMFELGRGYYESSCVGRIDYIKGKIDDEAYNFLFNIFRMNYKITIEHNDNISYKIKKEIEQILK